MEYMKAFNPSKDELGNVIMSLLQMRKGDASDFQFISLYQMRSSAGYVTCPGLGAS